MKRIFLLIAFFVVSKTWAGSEGAVHVPDASIDFTVAAERVLDQVVHIKSYIKNEDLGYGQRLQMGDLLGEDLMEEFFGPQPQRPKSNPDEQVATGSGVIISANGYIVTNNHVIDQATRVEIVMHDNRTFQASVIGTDLATDLAVLKIDADSLSYMPFANSDSVRVGQWVLAAGNPFNLNSTVTAGIVSAIARSVNLSSNKYAIESFIQTDAAINPGNSGGALVNLRGQLVGINTAIASPTGAYAGYGFAIPSNIVHKVSSDLIAHGAVQRGFLGVSIKTIDAEMARQKQLPSVEGVNIESLIENGAAKQAGMQVGDVIVSINGVKIKSAPQLQEFVGQHKPGDVLDIRLYRAKKELRFNVQLVNQQGTTQAVSKGSSELMMKLGIEAEAISAAEAATMNILAGIRVLRIADGVIKQQTTMYEGFVITKIDKKEISSPDDLTRELKGKEGGVLIEGRYADKPTVIYYGFGI